MSDAQKREAQKCISNWKSEGFEKCEPSKLGWNDEVRVIDNKFNVHVGKVCKVYPNEEYFLIVDSDKEFKRIYQQKLVRLYRKKFKKEKRELEEYKFQSDVD